MDKTSGGDKYNIETAEILANEAQHLPVAEATPIYEQLLLLFPTAAKFWRQYVEAYMATNNDDATKQIFSRCLLHCLQIPLWRCYIRFIRKVNDKKGMEGQEETRKAFDFMLNCVGADIASGPVWMEYIAFLKSLPAINGQEESHRMTTVRKVYQKAIVTPTHHIEQLWKDYENFENSVSRQLAKGLISEYQPKYNSARAVYRERKKYVDEIDWNMLAVPPSGSYKDFAMGKTTLTAMEQSGLYLLEFDDQSNTKIMSQQATSEMWANSQMWLQHQRLGHSSFSLIKSLFPHLFTKEFVESFSCDICQLSKHNRASYPISNKKSTSPFDIIHFGDL